MTKHTLGAALRATATQHADKVGFRVPAKSGFSDVLYRDVYLTVRRYAGTLRGLGLVKGDRVAILSENCVEWAYADWACQCLGLVTVPIYPTLPADQAGYIVADSGTKVVLAGDEKQAEKTAALEGVRTLMLRTDLEGEPLSEGEINAAIDAVQPEDLSTLIYTSGTTGQPKGVMLPHRAPIHVCKTVEDDPTLPIGVDDTFLCFLPMSHVYERVAGQALPVYLGATLGFAKSLASLANDIVAVKPTIMLCVPRFLENLRDRVLDKVSKDPPIRQRIFHLAVAQGTRKAQGKFAPLAGVLDKLVGAKVRERTGGRIRYFVSGGAALAPVVAEFYMAMGLNVLQGYGLTESSGGSVINRPGRNKYWTVGEPLGVEIRLAEDGEILLRGPAIMQGYYHLPEETAKTLDADGWLHTGDLGEFEGKNLKITDRKKDILVLGNGKNVAPQPVENKLKASPYISEAVLLGDGMDSCVALIIPNFEAVRHALKLPESAVLSQSAEAKALIKREVDTVNKTLANFEMVKRHALLDAPFTIESGELTPSLKVKRKVVREKYASIIDALR